MIAGQIQIICLKFILKMYDQYVYSNSNNNF